MQAPFYVITCYRRNRDRTRGAVWHSTRVDAKDLRGKTAISCPVCRAEWPACTLEGPPASFPPPEPGDAPAAVPVRAQGTLTLDGGTPPDQGRCAAVPPLSGGMSDVSSPASGAPP